MQIPLNDLRRNRRGSQPEFPANKHFDLRRKMGAGPNRAGKFANGHGFFGGFQPLQRAAKFVMHQGQIEPKGGRLGVNAVAAPNHRGELKFPRLGGNDLPERLDIRNQNVGRLRHLDGKGGIDDITAGQAKVQPAAGGRANIFGDIRGEGNDVMVERAFQFLAPFKLNAARAFICAKSFFGTNPCRDNASLASSSICSQISSLRCSLQISRISARE